MVSRCHKNDVYYQCCEFPYYICRTCYVPCELVLPKGNDKMTQERLKDVPQEKIIAGQQGAVEAVHQEMLAILGDKPQTLADVGDVLMQVLASVMVNHIANYISLIESEELLSKPKDEAADVLCTAICRIAQHALKDMFNTHH